MKRFSILATITCLVAAISGAFFFDVDAIIYEALNGPQLVTNGFIPRLSKAYTNTSKVLSNDFHICSKSMKSFTLAHLPERNKQVTITTITRIGPDSFQVVTEKRLFSNDLSLGDADPNVSTKTMNQRELNKLIDKRYLPDQNTRTQKKTDLLRTIEELSSSNSKPL